MKPPPFAYVRPQSLEETTRELRADEVTLLAGGQSLIPMLNLRIARPRTIVDISRVPGLDRIDVAPDRVEIGAMVTHSTIETHNWPDSLRALPEGVSRIGYRAIRNRGTIGGSLAHADPAAELPSLAMVMGASINLESTSGKRTVSADDFFLGYYSTARNPDELITSVTFPIRPGQRSGFAELSRRTGDFAIALAAVTKWGEGDAKEARVVVGGLDTRPRRIPEIEDSLVGDEDWTKVCTPEILASHTNPSDDIHGSAGFRLQMGAEMVARSIKDMED